MNERISKYCWRALGVGTVLLVLALHPQRASAQCAISYGDIYADETNVYAWSGVTDYYNSYCYPGTYNFIHNYYANLTLYNPSGGRLTNGAGFTQAYGGGGATEAWGVLAIQDEFGLWTFSRSEAIYCSILGGTIYTGGGGGTVQVQAPFVHVGDRPAGADSCGPLVERGQSISIKLEGVPAQNVTGWSFTGGIYSIAGENAGNDTWTGELVLTGVVRVDYVGGFKTCSVGALPRDWQLINAPLAHPGGAPNGTFATLPTNPTAMQGQLGNFQGYVDYGSPGIGISTDIPGGTPGSERTITSGPNTGFKFYTVKPVVFADWQFNDSLLLPATFATKQCGTWPLPNNPNGGWISQLNLLAQVLRHEMNNDVNYPNESHYGRQGFRLQTVNPGTYLESKVWGPGSTLSYNDFYTQITVALAAMNLDIITYSGDETAFPGANSAPHRPDSTANGDFIGFVNYSPYTNC